MNIPSITREFHFSYGHRLMSHKGGCRNIHGHNGILEITVSARVWNGSMVMDFADFKTIANRWIEDYWDHAFLLQKTDKTLLEFLQNFIEPPNDTTGQWSPKIYLFDDPPTAETMARSAYWGINNDLPDNIEVKRVVMHETRFCRAEYCP